MRSIAKQTLGAAVGALTIGVIAAGPAAAADLSLNEGPTPQYQERQTYSEQSRVDEYVEREPPPVYREVGPPLVYAPPPVAYYAPPPVLVPPPAYYYGPYRYRVPAYVVARRGPNFVGPWRHPRRW